MPSLKFFFVCLLACFAIVAMCYHSMVLPRERAMVGSSHSQVGESGEGARYFDYVLRSRWDLAFATPSPPIVSLRKDAIHVPYNYW